MLKIAGIVSNVKLLSLKHKTPSAFSVVLDTYTENPMNRGAKPFPGPEKNDRKRRKNQKICISYFTRQKL